MNQHYTFFKGHSGECKTHTHTHNFAGEITGGKEDIKNCPANDFFKRNFVWGRLRIKLCGETASDA